MKEDIFEQNDYLQMGKRGISTEECLRQYELLKSGVPYIKLIRAAVLGDGIVSVSPQESDRFISLYENSRDSKKVVKFIPASGGATRMFKFLLTLMDTPGKLSEEDLIISSSSNKDCREGLDFFQALKDNRFAFKTDLMDFLQEKGKNLNEMLENSEYEEILNSLLFADGLNYSSLPKALLKFHKYDEYSRTPLEEHFYEGSGYSLSNNRMDFHITLSPHHKPLVEGLIKKLTDKFMDKGIVVQTVITEQKPFTDTIAVDEEGLPFRKDNGELLFRPGGHGALIANLNEIEGDVIFIKNIDNVVTENYVEDTVRNKKLLAGILLDIKGRIDEVLDGIEHNRSDTIEKGILLCRELFNKEPDPGVHSEEELMAAMVGLLNRPVRVCGVVKNTGEPGGGPFWIEEENGSISLQIVEGAQIDISDTQQKIFFEGATHFNPVDIVCSTLNYKKEKFDLRAYVDHSKSFISEKSLNGKKLKALEHPGLWNGSMSDWITVMVEVPGTTFNPVKTVNDLLKPLHQGL